MPAVDHDAEQPAPDPVTAGFPAIPAVSAVFHFSSPASRFSASPYHFRAWHIHRSALRCQCSSSPIGAIPYHSFTMQFLSSASPLHAPLFRSLSGQFSTPRFHSASARFCAPPMLFLTALFHALPLRLPAPRRRATAVRINTLLCRFRAHLFCSELIRCASHCLRAMPRQISFHAEAPRCLADPSHFASVQNMATPSPRHNCQSKPKQYESMQFPRGAGLGFPAPCLCFSTLRLARLIHRMEGEGYASRSSSTS